MKDSERFMNLGTASGLNISTFPMLSCLNRTSVQPIANRIPNFVLRNRLGWQRLYNVRCNQFSHVSNFYYYNVTLKYLADRMKRKRFVIVIIFSITTELKLCSRFFFDVITSLVSMR
jgi:hypothetical protein